MPEENDSSPRTVLGFVLLIFLIFALPWLVIGLVKYTIWIWNLL